jgi:hypothetical protein
MIFAKWASQCICGIRHPVSLLPAATASTAAAVTANATAVAARQSLWAAIKSPYPPAWEDEKAKDKKSSLHGTKRGM